MVEGRRSDSTASVCQTCGHSGFKELLLSCSKCQISLEHRYCLAVIPKADDEEFTYTCAGCVLNFASQTRSERSLQTALHSRPSFRKEPIRQESDELTALIEDVTNSSPVTQEKEVPRCDDPRVQASFSEHCVKDVLTQADLNKKVDSEVQTCAIPPSKTSIADPSVKDAVPEADLDEDKRSPHSYEVNGNGDQELKRRIHAEGDKFDKEVEGVEGEIVPRQADLNDNNRSRRQIDHHVGGLVQDLKNSQVNSRSVDKVEAEVQAHDVPPSVGSSIYDPSAKDVLAKANPKENTRSPHSCDVNSNGDQERRRKRRRLIHDDWDKSDEEVEGQQLQVVPIAQVDPVVSDGPLKILSPHSFIEKTDYVYAQPIFDPVWRGCFQICKDKVGRLAAHLSNKACLKVVEAAHLMPALLSVTMIQRLEAWPKSFNASAPTDESIALYIFPGGESVVKVFDELMTHIIKRDLALKVLLNNVELLIFSSNQLPLQYWRFKGKYYLWGVFRGRKGSLGHESGDSYVTDNSSTICNMPPPAQGINKRSDSTERMSSLSPLSVSGNYCLGSPRSPLANAISSPEPHISNSSLR